MEMRGALEAKSGRREKDHTHTKNNQGKNGDGSLVLISAMLKHKR
jgi:hypothetical protein